MKGNVQLLVVLVLQLTFTSQIEKSRVVLIREDDSLRRTFRKVYRKYIWENSAYWKCLFQQRK